MSVDVATPEQLDHSSPASAPKPAPHADDERLMHHEYDGIQEFDNALPFWWSGIFVLCIIHSAWYLYWYHGGGPGKSIHEQYAADFAAWQKPRRPSS